MATTERSSAADTNASQLPSASEKTHVDEAHNAPQPKRFSALNINQRFLQSAKEAAPKASAPAPTPAPVAEDARPGHHHRLVTAMPGRGTAGTVNAAADPARKEAPKDTPTTPRVPWAHVKPAAPRVNISSQDFPTAKEVMEAEKRAEERAAEEHARQQAAHQELERFRGAQLPSTEHWDKMDEESEDELDDVVEFGDGKQYKISEVEEELAKTHPPRVPAWSSTSRAPWRTEPVSAAPPAFSSASVPAPVPAPAPAPAPSPAATWGPLAQRHSTLTGKPLPKMDPPVPAVPSKDRAAEMAAEQHDEMATAAERARKRREQDEQAREAERERARQKAAQIEEQLRAAEQAKREERERELEAQRERLRERQRAQQEAREEHARQRLERERKEREAREQRRLAKEEARQASEASHPADEATTWRRTTPLPSSTSSASPAPRVTSPPVQAESPVTCEPLPPDEAPVWRQYVVRMPRQSRVLRLPSGPALRTQSPRDPPSLLQSCEPPLDYARVTPRATAVDILFPPRRARVHLPQRRLQPAAPRAFAPQRPLDEARWLEQLLGNVEQHPSGALFADEAPIVSGARPRRKRAPRVKLPSALSWRRPSLKALPLPYTGLLDDPFASAPEVPLLDAQSQSTWGATPLALPLMRTAQPDDAEHSRLKSMWANSSETESRPKNSLRDIATDDMLPSPLPLSMHELRETPANKLDVLALPFRPGQSADHSSWRYPRDRPPGTGTYYTPIGGYASRRTVDTDAYVNPADYSDFVLSDSW
ncbi:hypothetical protein MNAN1_001990 [Malassezia nana]|uniref:Uncharacterized protein n=1 Tax=Malassezia nana TaxID=180528 RepID=A0AAF0EK66_9BASI|nr:hypothetical protein MNAN1_001990 [Malassezia nana]